ncbi:glutathione-dependent formaldehyde dehydrogenase [Luteolibacter sp. GHJ8]|uniref:Glutathione-dependent formaldehyde dehydrogenase n=1 Tax=Luteolibacter rhizosphaerae TaxID=2989719 RepID=A0ABT3G7Q4_9BACT|nr:zinc-dependent alcohol dehydrogenase [Luteolibacter rhizosphaerae]MCW1915878.1 glutathione-dependent formaldehyde dehydrogenase [Luteolibacter rhizosphaerae]
MKALCWHGVGDVRVDRVPDPAILDPKDIIIQITASGICGSDLHLYDGLTPTMEEGDIIGHEPMGIVVEVGGEVKKFKKGDRVVVPFVIACGCCFFCQKQLFSACDTTNPGADLQKAAMGQAGAGLFGYSGMMGRYPGGQAEFLRVPHADVGPIKIDSGLSDEQVLFLSDIFPTGYQAAENAGIEAGDTVAVWGCGPVGQFTIQCAWMFGAARVIAIDHVPERLEMARVHGRAEVLNFQEEDIHNRLIEMTGGRGPDRCIDAVGAEAHGTGSLDAVVDRAKQALKLSMDRPHALRQAIMACRKGGTLSIPGVYFGLLDKIPVGALVGKGLTVKSGQTHVQKYLGPLLEMIDGGKIDPSFVITHRIPLEAAPDAYEKFRKKEDGCIKVVIKPGMDTAQVPA